MDGARRATTIQAIFRSGAIALLALVAACENVVVPPDQAAIAQMTPAAAHDILDHHMGPNLPALYPAFPCQEMGCGGDLDNLVYQTKYFVQKVFTTPHEIFFRTIVRSRSSDNNSRKDFHYPLAGLQPVLVLLSPFTGVGFQGFDQGVPIISLYNNNQLPYLVFFFNANLGFAQQDAQKVLSAFLVLKQAAANDQQEDARFAQTVASYRGNTPEISEEIRRYAVQADGAVKDKDFFTAIQLYGQALDTAPWWADGHYNRALILAELGAYPDAIMEMKRYLLLMPNAPNAREVQDQIYDWQRKAQ